MSEIQMRDYFPAVERFLKELDTSTDVRSVVMVALTGETDMANLQLAWHCGPFELSHVAGLLNLSAAREYLSENYIMTPRDDAIDEEDEADESLDQ